MTECLEYFRSECSRSLEAHSNDTDSDVYDSGARPGAERDAAERRCRSGGTGGYVKRVRKVRPRGQRRGCISTQLVHEGGGAIYN